MNKDESCWSNSCKLWLHLRKWKFAPQTIYKEKEELNSLGNSYGKKWTRFSHLLVGRKKLCIWISSNICADPITTDCLHMILHYFQLIEILLAVGFTSPVDFPWFWRNVSSINWKDNIWWPCWAHSGSIGLNRGPTTNFGEYYIKSFNSYTCSLHQHGTRPPLLCLPELSNDCPNNISIKFQRDF